MIVLAFARNTIYLDPGVKHRDDTYEKIRNQDLNYVHKKKSVFRLCHPVACPDPAKSSDFVGDVLGNQVNICARNAPTLLSSPRRRG